LRFFTFDKFEDNKVNNNSKKKEPALKKKENDKTHRKRFEEMLCKNKVEQ